MIIQTWYLLEHTQFTPLVLISMTFTVLSFFVAFFTQISRMCQLKDKRSRKFLNKDEATIRMTIKCVDLKPHHAFSHQKIEQCLSDVLYANKTLSDLQYRKDASFSFEVININEKIQTRQSLIVICQCIILTQDASISVSQDSERKIILDNIKNLGVHQHPNNKDVQTVCTNNQTFLISFAQCFMLFYVRGFFVLQLFGFYRH